MKLSERIRGMETWFRDGWQSEGVRGFADEVANLEAVARVAKLAVDSWEGYGDKEMPQLRDALVAAEDSLDE